MFYCSSGRCIVFEVLGPMTPRFLEILTPRFVRLASPKIVLVPFSIGLGRFRSTGFSPYSTTPQFSFAQSIASLRMSSHSPVPVKVLVLGSGNFGSCLADHLGLFPLRCPVCLIAVRSDIISVPLSPFLHLAIVADSEHEVMLWSRSRDVVESLNATHRVRTQN